MKIPLTKKVLETDDTRDLGSIGITSAQIGMYSELEVDGTTTADIVKVIGKCVFYSRHVCKSDSALIFLCIHNRTSWRS